MMIVNSLNIARSLRSPLVRQIYCTVDSCGPTNGFSSPIDAMSRLCGASINPMQDHFTSSSSKGRHTVPVPVVMAALPRRSFASGDSGSLLRERSAPQLVDAINLMYGKKRSYISGTYH
jgi:hypothetical protein